MNSRRISALTLAFGFLMICRSQKIKIARGNHKAVAAPFVSAYKFFQLTSFAVFVLEIVMIGIRLVLS